jgi:hypothetical protein
MAWNQGFQEQSIRRETDRRSHGYQSARAGAGRQLWSMGWVILHIRLRCQGNKEEGGPV